LAKLQVGAQLCMKTEDQQLDTTKAEACLLSFWLVCLSVSVCVCVQNKLHIDKRSRLWNLAKFPLFFPPLRPIQFNGQSIVSWRPFEQHCLKLAGSGTQKQKQQQLVVVCSNNKLIE